MSVVRWVVAALLRLTRRTQPDKYCEVCRWRRASVTLASNDVAVLVCGVCAARVQTPATPIAGYWQCEDGTGPDEWG